ncbi:hypothetical protein XAP6164_1760018 [Xanthomonas phaseoli pv. phaseoli]|nr:hypothetical protein XAP6164_1760018 [Xanthomonas phaseoli pv. phaseoli]
MTRKPWAVTSKVSNMSHLMDARTAYHARAEFGAASVSSRFEIFTPAEAGSLCA